MIDIMTSLLASTARSWRGTSALVREKQPEKLIVLYDMEGCPYCQPVREALTELDLDVLVKACPKEQPGHWAEIKALSGTKQVPFLVDDNTGTQCLNSDDIIAYLYKTYGDGHKQRVQYSTKRNKLASLIRSFRGIKGRPSNPPAQPLELYSFESSPFSRPVRERLSELGLAYIVRNSGKQQLSDLGVPWLRPGKGPYQPVPGTNREKLMAKTGKVQFPFLHDPNTETEMFESKAIVRYLQSQYGR